MKNRFFFSDEGGLALLSPSEHFMEFIMGFLKWAYRFGPENILSEEEKTADAASDRQTEKEIDEFEEEDFPERNYF